MKYKLVEKRFALAFAEIKSRDNALWALARAGQIAKVYLGSRVDQELWDSLAGCGKSRFRSKLGVFLVTQNRHPRPFLRSWDNCARFVFRAFLPKRLFPQPARVR